MTKQERIDYWKQNLINENWDADLAQAEAERIFGNTPDDEAPEPLKPKATRKRKEPTV
jgi:hypothetical protein